MPGRGRASLRHGGTQRDLAGERAASLPLCDLGQGRLSVSDSHDAEQLYSDGSGSIPKTKIGLRRERRGGTGQSRHRADRLRRETGSTASGCHTTSKLLRSLGEGAELAERDVRRAHRTVGERPEPAVGVQEYPIGTDHACDSLHALDDLFR